jgi:hypothetical protein
MATLEATDAAIGQVFAPYCPGGRHGHQIWLKNVLWYCEIAVPNLAGNDGICVCQLHPSNDRHF